MFSEDVYVNLFIRMTKNELELLSIHDRKITPRKTVPRKITHQQIPHVLGLRLGVGWEEGGVIFQGAIFLVPFQQEIFKIALRVRDQ